MARERRVRLTRSFERNLDEIRDFLAAADASSAFEDLVTRLLEEIIPSLQRFPEMGTDFLARAPLSAQGLVRFERAAKLAAGAPVRQLIDGDYLVLYLVQDESIDLLAIRHHRQLSFDLRGHWP